MKKIILLTTLLCILGLTNGCQTEMEIYNPGDRVEASFPSTVLRLSMVAADNNQIQVEMWRGNAKEAASVPVTIQYSSDGVFTPEKAQFDFSAGQYKAYLKFSYESLNNFGGETYTITLSITNPEQVSRGGNESITVSAKRKLTFQSIGTGTFTSEFFGESWPQEVLKAVEGDYYRLPDCYATGYSIEFGIVDGNVSFSMQPTGYISSSYGMVSWDPEYLPYCYIDGKTITFAVNFTVEAGSFGGFYEVLELP
jgi:hypothetical protein